MTLLKGTAPAWMLQQLQAPAISVLIQAWRCMISCHRCLRQTTTLSNLSMRRKGWETRHMPAICRQYHAAIHWQAQEQRKQLENRVLHRLFKRSPEALSRASIMSSICQSDDFDDCFARAMHVCEGVYTYVDTVSPRPKPEQIIRQINMQAHRQLSKHMV